MTAPRIPGNNLAAGLGIFLLTLLLTPQLLAGELRIASAANFTLTMKDIARHFEQASGHHTLVSYGSTGKLYAQIVHGAPFDVFLAADQARPQRLEERDLASDRFTYANGQLALWRRDGGPVSEDSLRDASFRRLAIANPKTAPYGSATIEVLKNLKLYQSLADRLVLGDSVSQTHQFVATGNAEFGFVAYAQVLASGRRHIWVIPQRLYTPIRQDAVLLDKGEKNPAALAFMEYLGSEAARSIIQKHGYVIE